ncbi:hypothetical protein B0T18DRAFT_428618 [Schizothecium vesticola]|uniref:DUF6604 domain-containing protein n=1 Tax=Schizothecium vesticola TaxID=314040 RepID=A0AA40EU08_9PEZI|nr:hypothetical protein B0T18DRAFT_428618 [Schizothecium vesticola]
MSPPWLASTYGEYKDNVLALAAWLLSTANEAKAERENFPGTVCHKFPEILDSEYLKAMNKNGGLQTEEDDDKTVYEEYQTSDEGEETSDECIENYDEDDEQSEIPRIKIPKIIFRESDFEELTEWISALQPSVAVPVWVVATLDRLDDVRRTLLQDLNIAPDADYAAGHLPSLDIFEEVRSLLGVGPRVQQATEATEEPRPEPEAADESSQIHPEYLEYLSREEQKPPRELIVMFKGKIEFQTSFDQAVEMYGMLVHDLNKVRDTIKGLWSGVEYSGDYNPAVAAVSTDWALKLARLLIGDLYPIFNLHPFHKLSAQWHLMFMRARRFSTGQGPHDAYGCANKTFRGTWVILNDFFRQPKHTASTHLQLPQWGDYGEYNPEADRNAMISSQKIVEDRVLLMDMVGQLLTVTCLMPSTFPAGAAELEEDAEELWWEDACTPLKFPIADEFMLLVGEARRRSNVTMALVFAAQVFLDIHHTMRKDVEKVYLSCMDEINRVVGTLTEHFTGKDRSNTHPEWTSADNNALIDLLEKTKWIFSDPIQLVKRDELIQIHWRNPLPASMPHNAMLRSSPVLSGLLAYHFRVEMHSVGVDMCETWGSLPYAWHLYNACQQQDLIQGKFQDLEEAYSLSGSMNFHPDSKPTNINECFATYCHHVGLTESIFDYPDSPSPRRYPFLTYSTFRLRYGINLGKFDWVYAIPWLDHSKMSAPALVKETAAGLQRERPELYFPWIELHNACCWLMDSIKDEMADVLPKVMLEECGVLFPRLEEKLPFLVGFILAAAKGRMENPADMGPLRSAAKVLQDVIDSGNSGNMVERSRTFWDVRVGIAGQELDEKSILQRMRDNFMSQALKDLKSNNYVAPPTYEESMKFARMVWGDEKMWNPVPPPKTYTLRVKEAIGYRHVLIVRADDDW